MIAVLVCQLEKKFLQPTTRSECSPDGILLRLSADTLFTTMHVANARSIPLPKMQLYFQHRKKATCSHPPHTVAWRLGVARRWDKVRKRACWGAQGRRIEVGGGGMIILRCNSTLCIPRDDKGGGGGGSGVGWTWLEDITDAL